MAMETLLTTRQLQDYLKIAKPVQSFFQRLTYRFFIVHNGYICFTCHKSKIIIKPVCFPIVRLYYQLIGCSLIWCRL